jgi:sugar phosphate isomerase/epimerase
MLCKDMQDPTHFTEIGEGTLNIPAILEAVHSLGYARYIFVEQDVTSRDELEGIAISYTNLERMLNSL